jgi:hypothetical protein
MSEKLRKAKIRRMLSKRDASRHTWNFRRPSKAELRRQLEQAAANTARLGAG